MSQSQNCYLISLHAKQKKVNFWTTSMILDHVCSYLNTQTLVEKAASKRLYLQNKIVLAKLCYKANVSI